MFLLSALLFSTGPTPKPFDLSVDNIMRGADLIGDMPRNFRWSEDGKSVEFTWKNPIEQFEHRYSVNADGTDLKTAQPPAQANNGVRSTDGKAIAFVEGAKIVVRNATGSKSYESDGLISDLRWMADDKRIAYTSGNSEILLALDSGDETELASYVAPGQGAAGPPAAQGQTAAAETPSRTALTKEQTELFPAATNRRGGGGAGFGGRGRRGRGGGATAADASSPIELKANQTAGAFDPSPDGVHTVVPVFETTGESRSTTVPNYITADGYTADINSYPKVGDIHSRSTLALTTKGGKPVWLTPPDAVGKRDYFVNDTEWSKDGKTLISEIVTVDHKDRYITKVDPDSGKCTTLFTDHDDAWLGGPGSGQLALLPDHKRLYFESEKDGWAHLYTLNIESGELKQLTSGQFEVSRVRLSKSGDKFYFMSSEGSPFKRHYDWVSADGGARTRLFPPGKDDTLDGDSAVSLSPDESHAAYLRSWINHPPELYLSSTAPGSKEVKVTESPTDEWKSYKWTVPERVEIPASDGVKVPADFYRPPHFHAGGPAVIFVHGAGYLQNVHDWWKGSYYHEYMFNHVLASKGVAVLDIDYRASAGYGRDWRTAVYRFMGGRDLDDNVDGANWLVKKVGVSPKRIGMYGGSYGGFITLMAMFTKPGVFAAGAALRPVSDWANYNDGYTSDILNLPQDDPVAYRRSSPIFHADGLEGNLLICHGVVDTNVHYQDTVRLVQHLIDLKKENWSVAFYPMEDHTFSRQSSWSDEYRRILKLFQETLHF